MTSRAEAIEKLQALQEAGVEMSRNRNFKLFSEPDNRAALSLSRYLDALADEIVEGERVGGLTLTLEPGPEVVTLRVQRTDLSVQHLANLNPRELDALAERDGVRALLRRAGYPGGAGA